MGDNSYLVAFGDEAAVVDPQRDIGRFLSAARARDVSIRYVLETHVHNDYVSGALDLKEATGAEIVAAARGGYEFPHRMVAEGDELKLGELRLLTLETPGHTPEHVAYVVQDFHSDEPVAVFTGGSLMVGGAGRTDLLGDELTEELTRAQYRTMQRFAKLPDSVQVLPTHGAGSFCGVGGPRTKDRVSTIGEERTRNAALIASSEEEFVREQLFGLLAYPMYYRHMAPINRMGPTPLNELRTPHGLSAERVAKRLERGVWAVDARSGSEFARAHIPGSVNVELAESFGSYVGWVVPFNDPLLLVLPEPEDASLEEAITQLWRVGYERIQGYLAGGMDAWAASLPVSSYAVAGWEDLCWAYRSGEATHILDVRQKREWDRGHIPESRHIFVGDLPSRIDDVPRDGEVWAICASGQRSSIAASLLDREGIRVRLVDGTGVRDFVEKCLSDEHGP
ncbi:MAG: MBL fold metallo-hydrolase [Actinomycetota bacterium]|nr:MBL fold metallo-hydrolase [Actinomycetota bacterium]